MQPLTSETLVAAYHGSRTFLLSRNPLTCHQQQRCAGIKDAHQPRPGRLHIELHLHLTRQSVGTTNDGEHWPPSFREDRSPLLLSPLELGGSCHDVSLPQLAAVWSPGSKPRSSAISRIDNRLGAINYLDAMWCGMVISFPDGPGSHVRVVNF